MVDAKEIARKAAEMMDLAITDTENQDEHFAKLLTYLEGLGDTATSQIDQVGIPLFRMIIQLTQGLLKSRQYQDQQFHEMTKNINSVLEKVVRLENELEEMKKGK